MNKVYVGTALTHAPQEHKTLIKNLKNDLRGEFAVLDFVGLINGTPKDVYEWDTKCVHDCDYFIADCSYPAIGLGYEIGIALSINKPILAVAKQDAKVTRLVLGINAQNYKFKRYKTYSDLKKMSLQFLYN